MKTLQPRRGLSGPMLLVLYVAAMGVFLIGLNSFLMVHRQTTLIDTIQIGFGYMIRLAGWTVFGFLPLAAILAALTYWRVVHGPLTRAAKHTCTLIEVVAWALGLMGMLTHLLQKGDTVTFVGTDVGPLAIGTVCFIWSILVSFDFQHLQSVETAPPPPAGRE